MALLRSGTQAHSRNVQELDLDNDTLWMHLRQMSSRHNWHPAGLKTLLDQELSEEQREAFGDHVDAALFTSAIEHTGKAADQHLGIPGREQGHLPRSSQTGQSPLVVTVKHTVKGETLRHTYKIARDHMIPQLQQALALTRKAEEGEARHGEGLQITLSRPERMEADDETSALAHTQYQIGDTFLGFSHELPKGDTFIPRGSRWILQPEMGDYMLDVWCPRYRLELPKDCLETEEMELRKKPQEEMEQQDTLQPQNDHGQQISLRRSQQAADKHCGRQCTSLYQWGKAFPGQCLEPCCLPHGHMGTHACRNPAHMTDQDDTFECWGIDEARETKNHKSEGHQGFQKGTQDTGGSDTLQLEENPTTAAWGHKGGRTSEAHRRWHQPRMDPMLDTESQRYNYEEWVRACQKHWCCDRRDDPRWLDLWDQECDQAWLEKAHAYQGKQGDWYLELILKGRNTKCTSCNSCWTRVILALTNFLRAFFPSGPHGCGLGGPQDDHCVLV